MQILMTRVSGVPLILIICLVLSIGCLTENSDLFNPTYYRKYTSPIDIEYIKSEFDEHNISYKLLGGMNSDLTRLEFNFTNGSYTHNEELFNITVSYGHFSNDEKGEGYYWLDIYLGPYYAHPDYSSSSRQEANDMLHLITPTVEYLFSILNETSLPSYSISYYSVG